MVSSELSALRAAHPLVLCHTNAVAMDFTANLLLAAGASPIMSYAVQEQAELARASQALLLNIGTVHSSQLWAMLRAGRAFHRLHRPIVLDPVGAGVSVYRRYAVDWLMYNCHPTIVRGNASEIATLVGMPASCRGVDSTLAPVDVVPAAERKAAEWGCVLVISGETDYVTDGSRTQALKGGSPMMTYITAMGCAESALMAAMASVQPDPFCAACSTMTLMNQVGSLAAKGEESLHSPATFRRAFLDTIFDF